MKLLENGIIPVYENNQGKAVNARELHEFLEVGKDFTTWMKDRIEKYGFVENEDFIIFTEIGENSGRPKTEYILTIDMAKELAMVQNNEKGSQARKYFIEVEKRYNQQTPACIEDLIIMQAQSLKDLRNQVTVAINTAAETKQEVQAIRDVVEIRPSQSWREETNQLVKKICQKLGDYQKPKDELYRALEERARCNLKIRLGNLRSRAFENCWSRTKINALNYLDVIADDVKLIEIYTTIVKEMAIKNKVA